MPSTFLRFYRRAWTRRCPETHATLYHTSWTTIWGKFWGDPWALLLSDFSCFLELGLLELRSPGLWSSKTGTSSAGSGVHSARRCLGGLGVLSSDTSNYDDKCQFASKCLSGGRDSLAGRSGVRVGAACSGGSTSWWAGRCRWGRWRKVGTL